jgi:three-Cys-motif partner protein
MNTYLNREQTSTKHFILRRYLQALVFKVLREWDVTYVDGFSGPWKSKTADFSDTSFMIAIEVLKDAQRKILEQTGKRRNIRCFFSESNHTAYKQLETAVAPHHKPGEGFEIKTFCGEFEDAVREIEKLIGSSFPLIFIDPTGWTGYPFEKIKPLFNRPKCEVLINFMYDFVNRFVASSDESTIASLDPILGGPGWRDRLDASLPRGAAVEKLFRETLKAVGNFAFVVSTKIDKSTIDRPHFIIAYGTKSREGLIAFRQIEYDALREHARSRATAKQRKRKEKTGIGDLLSEADADFQEATVDTIVAEQKAWASDMLLQLLLKGQQKFSSVVNLLLQAFMLRETNVKDICVDLARSGKIQNTWAGKRKPNDDCIIRVKKS